MSLHVCFEKHRELAQKHEDSVRMWLEDSAAVLRRHDRTRARQADPTSTAGGAAREMATVLGSAAGAALEETAAEATSEAAPLASVEATPAAASSAPAFMGKLRSEVSTASKAMRCAIAQQRLAVREFREAARLRPRDVDTQRRLRAARQALRSLQASLEPEQPQPFRRFLAHFNLSIRYWDLGKGQQAIAEAEQACDQLRAAGFDLGCAEHNLEVMAEVHGHFRADERRLQELVRKSPQLVGPSYELGVLYFDKRMLVQAEAQLKVARDRARAASALQLVGLDRRRQQLQDAMGPTGAPVWLTLEGRKNRKMVDLLKDIEDDLSFIAGLRQRWSAEEEAGKAEILQETGIRDGTRPHLLPCLRRRYSPDCRACDLWWSNICECTDINLHMKPIRPKSAGRLRKSASTTEMPH